MNDRKRKRKNHTNPENNLDSFSVMESAIALSVREEYFNLSKSIDLASIDYKEVLKESGKLFSENTPIETKKRILVLLAHRGTVESFRILEEYVRISEGNLRDWALLSLKECRMFLESVLLKEESGIISTGLGGRDNKLRYYFIVRSKEGLTLTENHRNTLKNGFNTISRKYNSQIEEIKFESDYAMIEILIPMDVAVGDVIEEGISECNRVADFLFIRYYVTNVKRPTWEEILEYLDFIRHGKK